MLRPYRSVILGLLVSALAACSQPVSSPPPPPANASAEETSQTLQTLAQEIQQAIQEIENALRAFFPQQLAGQNLLPGQANLPKALENLTALRWENLLSVRPLGLYPLATPTPLLRGQFVCTGGNCQQLGPSEDLEVRFRQQATDPWNKALADWDASTRGTPSPTVETHQPQDTQNTMETPTKAFFAVDLGENGSNEGEATFTAKWRPSTCLSGKYLLEPENLGLTGFLIHPTSGQHLVDLTELSLTTSATRLALAWNLSLLVQGNDSDLHTQGQVVINGTTTPGTCGSLLENFDASSGEVSIDLDTRTKSLHLGFRVPQVEENPVRIHIQNGILRVDSKVVTFEGILDDQNNNCVPGENLVLHFAGGQDMSLENFLIQHMGAQPCNQP